MKEEGCLILRAEKMNPETFFCRCWDCTSKLLTRFDFYAEKSYELSPHDRKKMRNSFLLNFSGIYQELLFWASSLLLSLQSHWNLLLWQCKTQYNERIITIANIPSNYPPLLIWNCQSLEACMPKVRFLKSTYRYQSQNCLIYWRH